MLDRENSQEN